MLVIVEQDVTEPDTVDVPGPSKDECGEPRPGPSKDGHEERWKFGAFTQELVQFEDEDERLHERDDWQLLDYVEQYIDTELMKLIADCTHAMLLVNSGRSLKTSVDEMYHFFGASILMSCVPKDSAHSEGGSL